MRFGEWGLALWIGLKKFGNLYATLRLFVHGYRSSRVPGYRHIIIGNEYEKGNQKISVPICIIFGSGQLKTEIRF